MYRLARLAGIKHMLAVGIVEALHHWTAKYQPRGDVGQVDDAEIAAAVKWDAFDGTPDQIVTALVGAGWLDRDPVHRLVVHDWWEHCDTFVHMVVARAKAEPFACGRAPKRKRISGEERKELDGFWTAYEQRVAVPPAGGIQPDLIPQSEIRAHFLLLLLLLLLPQIRRESQTRARARRVGSDPEKRPILRTSSEKASAP